MTRVPLLATYRQLWALLPRRFHWVALALIGGGVIGTLLEVLGVASLGMLLAELGRTAGSAGVWWLPVPQSLGGADNPLGRAQLLLLVCASVFLGKNVFLGAHAWLEATFAFRLQASISRQLLKASLQLDYEDAVKRSPSEYTALFTADMPSLVFHTLLPALTLLSEVALVAAMLAYLTWTHTMVTLVVSAVLVVCGALIVGGSRALVAHLGVRRQVLEDARVRLLQQTFGNLRDIYIYDASLPVQERLAREMAELASVYRGYQMMSSGPRFFLEFAMVAILLAMVAAGLGTHDRGTLIATVGVFAASGFRLLIGANRMIMSVQSLRFGNAALDRVWGALRATAGVRPDHATADAGDREGDWVELRVRGASYRHSGAVPSIGPVDLRVTRGQMVGIVGPSGAGKSTVLEMMAGLRHPTAGLVELVNAGGRRSSIAGPSPRVCLVGQSTGVLAATLRENIAAGMPPESIPDEAMWEALRLAHVEAAVRNLPAQLDAPMAEYGASMSGGQLQRVGIARALCRHSSFLLLDEPTSALDAATEVDLMRTLRQLTSRCGIVLVSHRSAPLDQCDCVYELGSEGLRLVRGSPVSLAA